MTPSPRRFALLFAVLLSGLTHAAAPGVVMLLSEPEGTRTQLVEQRGEARRELGTIIHGRGAVTKGVLVGNSAALITQVSDARDTSWGSTLLLVGADGKASALADRVAYASRPVVTASGELLISRGVVGAEPLYSKGFATPLRMDDVSVELIIPSTGASRVLLRRSGYLLFVAGVTETEALIYELRPGSTPLLGVNLKTAAVRTIVPHLELARDVSVTADGQFALFTERAADGWRVVKMSIVSGTLEVLARGTDVASIPFALPSGVAINGPKGLRVGERQLSCPHGAGIDELRVLSPDGRFVAGLHYAEGELQRPVLYDLSSGVGVRVTSLPGMRPELVGVRP